MQQSFAVSVAFSSASLSTLLEETNMNHALGKEGTVGQPADLEPVYFLLTPPFRTFISAIGLFVFERCDGFPVSISLAGGTVQVESLLMVKRQGEFRSRLDCKTPRPGYCG